MFSLGFFVLSEKDFLVIVLRKKKPLPNGSG